MCRRAAMDLLKLLLDLEEEALGACVEALEASQDSEGGGKPRLTIPMSLVCDMSKHPVVCTTKAAVNVSYKVTGPERELDDPAQMELELKEEIELEADEHINEAVRKGGK
jgi:hypothetical protein